MTDRQRPWPRAWLMTDERMGERLWEAIDRLPVKHSGIVFRHYRRYWRGESRTSAIDGAWLSRSLRMWIWRGH